jgi:hypothetical protein
MIPLDLKKEKLRNLVPQMAQYCFSHKRKDVDKTTSDPMGILGHNICSVRKCIVRGVFRYLGSHIREFNIKVATLLSSMASLFSFENYMRIHLVIMQAVGVGASATNIVLQALAAYLTHEVWTYIQVVCPTEWIAFLDAAQRLAADQLLAYGGRAQTELIKGTGFPAVAAGAYQLLIIQGK